MDSQKTFNDIEYLKWIQEELHDSKCEPKNLREDLYDCCHLLRLLANYNILVETFNDRDTSSSLAKGLNVFNRELLCKVLNQFAEEFGHQPTFTHKELMKENREQVLVLVQCIVQNHKETQKISLFAESDASAPNGALTRGRSREPKDKKSIQPKSKSSGSSAANTEDELFTEIDKELMDRWEKECMEKIKYVTLKKMEEEKCSRIMNEIQSNIQRLDQEMANMMSNLKQSNKSIAEAQASIRELMSTLEMKKKVLADEEENARFLSQSIQVKTNDIVEARKSIQSTMLISKGTIETLDSLIHQAELSMNSCVSKMEQNIPSHRANLQKAIQDKIEKFGTALMGQPRAIHRSPSNDGLNSHRTALSFAAALANPSEKKAKTPPKAQHQIVPGLVLTAGQKVENLNDIKNLSPYYHPANNLLEARHLSLNAGRDNKIRQLPVSISLLTKLESLWLHNNELSSLPADISMLTRLTCLTLDNNMFTSIPSPISKLTKLEVLTIQGNNIEEIPPWISRLIRLRHLQINAEHQTSIRRIPSSMKPMMQNLCKTDRYYLLQSNYYESDDPQQAWVSSYPLLPDRQNGAEVEYEESIPSMIEICSDLPVNLRTNFPQIKKLILPSFVLDGNGLSISYGNSRVCDTEGIRKAVEYFVSSRATCIVAIPKAWVQHQSSKIRPYPLLDVGCVLDGLVRIGIEVVEVNPTNPNSLATLAKERNAVLITNYRPPEMDHHLSRSMQGKIFPFRFEHVVGGERKFGLHFRDETLSQFVRAMK